jgi:putative hydrolase of the HAD superfamily
LLSNTNPKHIQDEIEKRYLFPQHIDGAVYSFNVGYRKPEESIYRIAAHNANVLPENCIFIDDRYENVRAAIRLGFTGIHFTCYEQLEMDLIQHNLKGTDQR